MDQENAKTLRNLREMAPAESENCKTLSANNFVPTPTHPPPTRRLEQTLA